MRAWYRRTEARGLRGETRAEWNHGHPMGHFHISPPVTKPNALQQRSTPLTSKLVDLVFRLGWREEHGEIVGREWNLVERQGGARGGCLAAG